MPVSADASSFPTYSVKINNTAPVWVFCRQTGHCGAGMVFSVNAVTSGSNTFSAFRNNAIEQNGTASAAKSASSAGATSGALSVRLSLARFAGLGLASAFTALALMMV